ncbi:hypothetical protein CHELA20_40344 [Hyphomicrobiales bacterium]|nr:hypothetical protein CHELA20_40344 [Hyphomicrobiales bacterium]CAH1688273.1 hypothetical protein CHELA41_40201 [Hyphomicrobiales bacterium]
MFYKCIDANREWIIRDSTVAVWAASLNGYVMLPSPYPIHLRAVICLALHYQRKAQWSENRV